MLSGRPYQQIGDADMEGLSSPAPPRREKATGRPWLRTLGIALGTAALLVLMVLSRPQWSTAGADRHPVLGAAAGQGLFDWAGRYVLRDYDRATPMANFLPGLGGYWGVPMWAFYVNRGQALASFGVTNKDGAVAKYNTAEKAYQQVPFDGFRTFLRGTRGKTSFSHMPFFLGEAAQRERNMAVGLNSLELTEIDSELQLNTTVSYFTITDEDFPALIRRTTFTNMHSDEPLHLEVLDGLACLEPSGLSNFNLDSMGRTMEAWMNVYNMNGTDHTQPFYHISQGTADTPQVQVVKEGHFVVAFVEHAGEEYGPEDLLPFVVDPRLVFGTDTTLSNPSGFVNRDSSFDDFMSRKQTTTSRTPTAFAGAQVTVPPGGQVTVTSIYGHALDLDLFLNTITPRLLSPRFVTKKFIAARELVFNLTSCVKTTTGDPVFDLYVQQNFLDNVLRGGLPVNVGNEKHPKIFHTFSRIHGDLERDYNNFQLDMTYFSQGPGNFRDVNQNRRNDVTHVPMVEDFNVRMFLSFVQSDGYNPLTVAGTNFRLSSEEAAAVVANCALPATETDSANKLTLLLTSSFRIGDLFNNINKQKIHLGVGRHVFLSMVMAAAEQVFAAQYAPSQGGFWADHWTYTLDLLDNYLYIYPEKKEHILHDSDPVPLFMAPAIVRDRKHRYSLCANPNSPGKQTVCAYKAVCQWGDPSGCFPGERESAMNQILKSRGFVADPAGAGGVWQQDIAGRSVTVSVFAKFLLLGVIKFSTLDPRGMGVEYEGGKPGWNDAMNGLPGLLGSGMPETFEMLRVLSFLNESLSEHPRSVSVPSELGAFMHELYDLLRAFFKRFPDGSSDADAQMAQVEFDFWNQSNTARERYRKTILGDYNGTYEEWVPAVLLPLLDMMIRKTEAGIRRAVALTSQGQTPTYFYYEADDYYTLPNNEPAPPPLVNGPFVFPRSFIVHAVPLFLEGPTRHMKTMSLTEDKRALYSQVRSGSLYDKSLCMFKISSALGGCVPNIGRMMAFAPGWLENESVWLHMSYKFYLELLRGGLYEEFYREIRTGLVPFMASGRYGRSPAEATSFIVSSAFPDDSLHGVGFLARLSGSTAEFLSMWALMMAGSAPFFVDEEGVLCLQLLPNLPSWLFTADTNALSFTFMGHTHVTYHNPARVDTWGMVPGSARLVADDGSVFSAERGVFKGGHIVSLVRGQKVASIDVYF